MTNIGPCKEQVLWNCKRDTFPVPGHKLRRGGGGEEGRGEREEEKRRGKEKWKKREGERERERDRETDLRRLEKKPFRKLL
jgi:hypothetical protein